MIKITHLSHHLILVCILLSTITTHLNLCIAIINFPPTSDFITTSCQTTLYPNLCHKTLSNYSRIIKRSPKRLAITALLVTFNTTVSTSRILRNLSRNRGLKRSEKAALIECMEEVADSVYELHKAVKKLNHTRKSRADFELRMNDVQTWVSAALTDEDTCMDDFTTRGKMKILVRVLVLRIARFTSISLAFINNYASNV